MQVGDIHPLLFPFTQVIPLLGPFSKNPSFGLQKVPHGTCFVWGCQQPAADAEKHEGPEHSLEFLAESEAGSSLCSLEWCVLSAVPLSHPLI